MNNKKKIGIVTVYNSYNYGSILQAMALYSFLQEYGEVYFLNTKARNDVVQGVKEVLRAVKYCKLQRVSFEIKRFRWFRNMKKNLPVINLEKANRICDTFVFGSDEIWNISRKQFSEFPIFWGKGVNGRKISYGPSINNTTKQDLQNKNWSQQLREFSAVSVRDLYSKKLLEEIAQKPIEVVVDPTMLLKLHIGNCSASDEPYIAMYISDNKFCDKQGAKSSIRMFANQKKLRLVSLGIWSDWADDNFVDLLNPPFYYYDAAQYVITNTFHGTVFAILQGKQFVSYAGKNQKIVELLSMLELSDRIVYDEMNAEQLDIALNKIIDYEKVNDLITRSREKSKEFLEKSL